MLEGFVLLLLWVCIVENLLGLVVVNLFDNVIKFSGENGWVVVLFLV